MNNNLTCDEYCWAVTYESLDDGYRLTDSYFTDMDKAENRARKLNKGAIVQTTLYYDSCRNYYEIEMKPVLVNAPTRTEVLKKLTHTERKVLGLE